MDVDIWSTGIRKYVISDKLKSAVMHLEVVTNYLASEVTLGRKDGPFSQFPFSKLDEKSVGVIITKCLLLVKYCIINHLI